MYYKMTAEQSFFVEYVSSKKVIIKRHGDSIVFIVYCRFGNVLRPNCAFAINNQSSLANMKRAASPISFIFRSFV